MNRRNFLSKVIVAISAVMGVKTKTTYYLDGTIDSIKVWNTAEWQHVSCWYRSVGKNMMLSTYKNGIEVSRIIYSK